MKKIFSNVMTIAVCSSLAVSNLASFSVQSLNVSAADENASMILYKDVLDMYYNCISNKWADYDDSDSVYGTEDLTSQNCSYMWLQYEKEKTLSEIGYQFIDINKDGVNELIVSPVDSQMIYDFYTIENDKVLHLFASGERDRLYLGSDNEICREGSDSVFTSYHSYYHVNQGLECFEAYTLENNQYFYGTGEDDGYDTSKMKQITEEEAYKGMESHVYQDLKLKSFSNYNNSNTVSEPKPFTEEQLNWVADSLGVPEDLPVRIEQDAPVYWETGSVWVTPVSVYYEDILVAGVHAESFTGEHIKEILMFSADKLPSTQNSGKCGENAFWEFNESTETLTISGTGAVTYGGWINDNSPIVIDENNNSNIKHIVIEEGITELYKYNDNNEFNGVAFGTDFTSISLPNTLTYIDDWFFSCSSPYALDFALKEVTIPASVTYIGEHAFNSQLTGDGGIIEYYDDFLINGYFASASHVYAINNNIEFAALDKKNFDKCGDNAYWKFDETTGTLTISGKGAVTLSTWMTYFADGVVYQDEDGNSNLRKIVVDEGITELHCGMMGAAEVTSISLPNTLTYIDDWCFSVACDTDIPDKTFALKEIAIPASVTYIGEHAFNSQFCGDGTIIEYYNDLTIKGIPSSTAQTYAEDNNIKFVALSTSSNKPGTISQSDTGTGNSNSGSSNASTSNNATTGNTNTDDLGVSPDTGDSIPKTVASLAIAGLVLAIFKKRNKN